MAKARIIDLQETKGNFQLKGIVSGTEKQGYYSDTSTSTNRAMRQIRFDVIYDENKSLPINLMGFEQDNVYFSKRENNKTVTEKVPWSERLTYNREGYRLIGCNIGVRKIINSEGNSVNDKKLLTDFDACKEVAENLKDGASVYVRGKIDYSSSIDDKGNKRTYIRLTPNQISLCQDVHFADSNYVKQNDFNQVIVFMGIEQETDSNEKSTGRFVVTAKIVTYNSIEDAEFIIENAKLARTFRTRLKPGNAIKVNGHIVSITPTETVSNDDIWGEQDAMEIVAAPNRREFIITGAKADTLDTDTYGISKIEAAMVKLAKANKAEISFADTTEDEDDDIWSTEESLYDDDLPF